MGGQSQYLTAKSLSAFADMSPTSFFIFGISLLLPHLPRALAHGHDNLTVDTEPTKVQPYVIPYLNGYAVQAFGYVLRFPVTNISTAGAISLLTVNGPKESAVPVHYHSRYHETFFVAKGAVNLYTFGVVHDLLVESSPWNYAVFPDYY